MSFFFLTVLVTSLLGTVLSGQVHKFLDQDKVFDHSLSSRGYYMHDFLGGGGYGGGFGKTEDISLFFLGVGVATLVGLATMVGPLFTVLLTQFTSAYQPLLGAGVATAGAPIVGKRRRREILLQNKMAEILGSLKKALEKYDQ